MTELPAGLQRLLQVNPADAGCDHAMEVLDAYAELTAVDPAAAATAYPGVAAHLEDCGPCADDLAGLLAALSDGDEPDPTT